MKKFNFTLKKVRITSGASFRGNSQSFSFNYRMSISSKKTSIIVYDKRNNTSLEDFLQRKDFVSFIATKNFGGDSVKKYSQYGDDYIDVTTGFIAYNGKIYVGKINLLSESNNGKGFSTTEWYSEYELILEKEIKIPKITKNIKDTYKTKEGVYVWDQEKKDFIINS